MSWHQQMERENENFYLKIWVFNPHFINSQIVVAYKEYLHYYDETLEKRKEFLYKQYHSIKAKLQQFNWELYIDTNYYEENELNERIIDGTFTKKEVQAIKDKAYKVKSIKNGNESNSIIVC